MKKIIVDGGMAANSKFMQTQADMFEGKIIEVRELDTCWGVAKGVLVARNEKINDACTRKATYRAGSNA